MSTNQTYTKNEIYEKIFHDSEHNKNLRYDPPSLSPIKESYEMRYLSSLIERNTIIQFPVLTAMMIFMKLSISEMNLVKLYCRLRYQLEEIGHNSDESQLRQIIHHLEKQVLDMYFVKYGYGYTLKRPNGEYYQDYELYL